MRHARRVPIIVLGLGGVGRALLEQILQRREYHVQRYNLSLQVIAVADSDGAAVAPEGLSEDDLWTAVAHKAQGGRLAALPFAYYQSNVSNIVDLEATGETVVADVTASEQTFQALLLARDRGASIVLANKLPLTRSLEEAAPLLHYPRLRYETTVGAALPVITTARRLAVSGESIRRIVGTFSGTLGYIMTAVEEGVAFSRAVARARELGYTEPDPREDLSGRDVARKALILARTLGWDVEMADVEVQSLFPEEWAAWPLEDFMAELHALDEDFVARRDAARAQHKSLRYVAEVSEGRVKVGIQFVPADSPLGRLRGTDNLIEFYTQYYDPQPLVIQGRGAGTQATAAGILSDIVELTLYPIMASSSSGSGTASSSTGRRSLTRNTSSSFSPS